MIKSAADFGALVRLNRKARGWTQSELAARCGTGDRFIIDLEHGKPTCQLGKALLVAREVGIELVDSRDCTPISEPRRDQDDDLSFLPKY